jgi:hypothetical protein
VDDADVALRNATYRRFVAVGRAPSPDEVADDLGSDVGAVRSGWRRLHTAHALVLDADGSIRMANPFSAVPTPHRVLAGARWWYANCAWDAFGVCAALQVDGRIESSCPDCGEPLVVEVRDGRPDRDDPLFHCLVPAHAWWDDIAFT